ncbi:MAG TPA: glycoside hydrolase family 2 TIM barrel-domain containing protein [Verrucomicrobiae bacterium]|jgi:exo-1,4-beta-D-glucosaminidase|nr:glycoside hydrolase family 2 TIM barrel-domain containing protein [Verrucomicrobiae bacterium]
MKPVLVLFFAFVAFAAGAETINLGEGWSLQSSEKIHTGGAVISTADFKPMDWYRATVPSTVVGCLVEDKVYRDPFFGMNMRSMPGVNYPIGVNFSNRGMSNNSPFVHSWWYRKEFRVEPRERGQVWLDFEGINYSANIWLNGKLVADDRQVAGAYRTYEFNVTREIAAGKSNVLAVEVFAPKPDNLGITWVDWNPAPPDKDMGLWREVRVTTTGPVAMRHPQVISKIDMPSLDKAHLSVSTDVDNASDRSAEITIDGKIEGLRFGQTVELAAHESKRVEFAPVNVDQPRLWWPSEVGPQNLYTLDLTAKVDGAVSDHDSIRFGIREATSEFNDKGYRVFEINGKPILVRGGGWAPDMFLRPSAEREIQELRYVKDMHLNAIRFEGKTENDRFLELCDREGIMVLAGWCCCDFWEQWKKWKPSDYDIASESLRDQLWRIRNHPSVIAWLYGSDNPPNEKAERNYLAVFKELNWPNSVLSSASGKESKAGAPTGVRMTGPYEYVPPIYWYVDKTAGGAYSFNTETSPGPAIPPIESLRAMLPKEDLWPIDNVWSFHAGGGPFKHLDIFTEALQKRLGEATGVEDYSRKAQVMAYDGERAMFEAYGRNKFDSTGVIQWMMNNAWPSMIWHLYDYYLRPGGGYFGAKKACEPIHIQYSYDDRSIVVVNNYYKDFQHLKATARLYNLDAAEKFSREAAVEIAANKSERIFTLPEPAGLTPVYFLKLTLEDARGATVSRNFYWLSTQPDTLGEPKEGSDWYYTPTRQFADFRALNSLGPADLKISATTARKGEEDITTVKLKNTGKSPAFFTRLKVERGAGGEEILPVLWEDNYLSLLPGEEREISATYAAKSLGGATPSVEMEGWNVAAKSATAGSVSDIWPAKVFAPYAFVPKGYFNIDDCLSQTGQKYYTLAFIISDSEGYPSWTGSRDLRVGTKYYADQISAIRAEGGDVLISFGGAGGAEMALKTPDVGKLEAQYQSVIDEYALTWMDFDIEGKALSNIKANQRRDEALARLQRKNLGLKISFTLPVNPGGMEEESLVMLRDAVTHGVKIESVNIMTMDYGERLSHGKKMGDLAVSASNASHRQTLAIDSSIKIGITPIIGRNDEKTEIFTLDDAREVMDFASKTDWVRSVGFWSSNRDRPKGARKGGNHSSGIDQKPWDFTRIFEGLSE